MTLHALITVDLDNGVGSSARAKFNEELKKNHFFKHRLTTIWTAVYVEGTTKASAIAFAKKCVDDAASIAGISTYEALVSISDEKPTEWTKTRAKTLTELLRGN
ncbi:hypothetical protein D3C77_261970 [compost metagenome]|jgi:hypothetical protein